MVKQPYRDLYEATNDKMPFWYDENGTPRYSKFTPDQVSNIYADEVALLTIQCQECERRFLVAISQDKYDYRGQPNPPLSEKLKQHGTLYYGDPPYHTETIYGGHCSAGYTMSSDTLNITEFWNHRSNKDGEFGWHRVEELEGLVVGYCEPYVEEEKPMVKPVTKTKQPKEDTTKFEDIVYSRVVIMDTERFYDNTYKVIIVRTVATSSNLMLKVYIKRTDDFGVEYWERVEPDENQDLLFMELLMHTLLEEAKDNV